MSIKLYQSFFYQIKQFSYDDRFRLLLQTNKSYLKFRNDKGIFYDLFVTEIQFTNYSPFSIPINISDLEVLL